MLLPDFFSIIGIRASSLMSVYFQFLLRYIYRFRYHIAYINWDIPIRICDRCTFNCRIFFHSYSIYLSSNHRLWLFNYRISFRDNFVYRTLKLLHYTHYLQSFPALHWDRLIIKVVTLNSK